MTNSSPAFLEPTEEDGDFLTGPASFLAAKAGNVVFFPGKHYVVAFLEPIVTSMAIQISTGATEALEICWLSLD